MSHTLLIRHMQRAFGIGALGAALLISASQAQADVETSIPDKSRILSIGGSLTEIVYALGEEKVLIGRDSTGTYPAEAEKLPDVGYMRALSPEGVLSIAPSGILLLEGSGPKEAIDVLKKASVPMVVIPEKFTHQGILDKIHAVGVALDVRDKADALAEKVDADMKSVEKLTADVKERKRVLFILSIQNGRLLASGKGTAADGAIALAGAVNVLDFPGYKQLTDEAIDKAAPDLILIMGGGGDHSMQVDELLKNPMIANTPAGKGRNIVQMDGLYLLGFGPRTGEAIKQLAHSLYGDAVAQ